MTRGSRQLLRPFFPMVVAMALAVTALAAPPAWVREASKADISEWKNSVSAVVLLESETVQYLAPDRVRRKIRRVLRLTKETGRREAIAALVYNADTARIHGAQAWVVTANGKKSEQYSRTTFADTIARYSDHFWDAHRVIKLNVAATVEIGGVLACEFEIEAQSGVFDSTWSFASGLPVLKSSFEVIPSAGGKLLWHATSATIPTPTPGATAGSLRWEMLRIAPLSQEQPTAFLPDLWSVSVRCVPTVDAETQTRTWEDLARLVAGVIEPRVVADAEVKALAAKLTAGIGDRWGRVRAITEFVQRDVPYLSLTLDKDSFAGYRPHLPADVLQRRLGDCKDKATLVAAMLRSLGEQGYVMLVHAQNPKALSPDWPSAHFNHAIVAIPADADTPDSWPTIDGKTLGRLVLFDATDPGTPLGVLPVVDQGGYGLIAAPNAPGLIPMPIQSAVQSGQTRRTTAQLSATGDLTVHVEETYLGYAAARFHQVRFNWGDKKFTQVLEASLGQTLPSATGLRWKDRWTASASNYRITLDFRAERHGRWVSREMMLVCPQLFRSHEPLESWKIDHEGVSWIAPEHMREETRLQLPEGFTVAEVPATWAHDTPLISCNLRYRLEGRELVFESDITRRTSVLGKADYEKLRAAYRGLDDAERRPVVLKRNKTTPPVPPQ